MQGTLADLRYALRLLRRSPGFTVTAVATLALGIGANVAIFSIVNTVLLQPLPYPAPDRLVALCETSAAVAGFCIVSPPTAEAWRTQADVLTDSGIARQSSMVLRDADGTRSVRSAMVTPGLFRTFGLQPLAGRLFQPQDVAEPLVVVSEAFARQRFETAREIVGTRLVLDELAHEVIGVLAAQPGIPRLDGVQVWQVLPFAPAEVRWQSWGWFRGFGRLADGVDPQAGADQLAAIQQRSAAGRDEIDSTWGVEARPLLEDIVGPVRQTLLSFMAAVALVLLIALVNVISLLLARSTVRRNEHAMRKALGASGWRLLRLQLAESGLLALAGTTLGGMLAVWSVDAFVALSPSRMPRLGGVGVDTAVLGYVCALGALVTVLTGITPAFGAWGADGGSLVDHGAERGGTRGNRGRDLLVVAEVALAVLLLIGSGLMARTFLAYLAWEPGFERRGLLVSFIYSSIGQYPSSSAVLRAHEAVADAVATLPGITAASLASAGPLFGGVETTPVAIENRPPPPPGSEPVLRYYDIGPDYLNTIGLAIRHGRGIDRNDSMEAPMVALVNEQAALSLFAGLDPIGERLRLLPDGPSMEIVGVVADVPPPVPGAAPVAEIYWPYAQMPRWGTTLVVRAATLTPGLVASIEDRIREVDPDLQYGAFRSAEELAGRVRTRPRFNLVLSAVFASVAAVLAAIGVYGLLAYAVAQRRHEIGVRMALGASPVDIGRRLLARGLALAAAGIVAGSLAALVLARALESMVQGVSSTDPLTYLLVGLLFLSVAAIACARPALRAARLDPAGTLRSA